MSIIIIMEGTPPLSGPALTNDLCGQYVKSKVNFFISAQANLFISTSVNVFISAQAKTALVLTLTLTF